MHGVVFIAAAVSRRSEQGRSGLSGPFGGRVRRVSRTGSCDRGKSLGTPIKIEAVASSRLTA